VVDPPPLHRVCFLPPGIPWLARAVRSHARDMELAPKFPLKNSVEPDRQAGEGVQGTCV
jgi:hypothetical protein